MQKKIRKKIYKQTQNQPFQNIPINSEHKTQECQLVPTSITKQHTLILKLEYCPQKLALD